MSRFATVLALAMCIGTSSASGGTRGGGGCDKRAKGIFDCEGKDMAYFEVRSIGK